MANRQMWLDNATKVPELLEEQDDNLMKKISSYSRKFRFTPNDVEKKIRSDKMFAAHFAKEPRRTNFHEKLAAQWLQELEQIEHFRTLPKKGKESLYVNGDGKIIKNGNYTKSKSLDFMWRTGNTTCYAMHKYTKQSGGDQDNQFKEMEALLRRFMQCENEDCILIVIVDGDYYTDPKMKTLRYLTRSHAPKSYAVHIEDVPAILDEYKT